MAQIIEFKRKIGDNLNEMLWEATKMRKVVLTNEDSTGVSFSRLERIFEGAISDVLLENKLVSQDFFLCGIYISGLLGRFSRYCPDSWFSIDYLIKAEKEKNPEKIKEGADVCFLLCSVFPERTEIRTMTKKDYIHLGGGLYLRSGTKIGRSMSANFETMVQVTAEAVAQLKD